MTKPFLPYMKIEKYPIFKSENGQPIVNGPNNYLVFIDETGDETLKDPNYPLFGLGGCGVLAKDYLEYVSNPWRKMKKEAFGKEDISLHATDLRNPSNTQLNALNSFFEGNPFARIAVTLTDKTKIFAPNLNRYQIVINSLMKRILHVARWTSFDSVVIFFEQSGKEKVQLDKYFPPVNLTDEKSLQNIPLKPFKMPKSQNEPGLEVADFIIHGHGTFVRARMKSKSGIAPKRKDWESIFGTNPRRLVSDLEINKVERGHNIDRDES